MHIALLIVGINNVEMWAADVLTPTSLHCDVKKSGPLLGKSLARVVAGMTV
jgi:hypothetical protein